jgi:DNA-binding NarL/FixJ family response regulator
VQRRARQWRAAREALDEAERGFADLGAQGWAERARAEAARVGGRRSADRDELTESERQIAELAAGGRSNREIAGELFVSARTVEAALTRAYRKLGVRSRTELARRLPS